MKNKFFIWMLLILSSITYANISISSMNIGAFVYVDGVKKGAISHVPLVLDIAQGLHEVMVSNRLDDEWQEVSRQNVRVKGDKLMPLVFNLRLEKLPKKNKKNSSQAKNFVKKQNIVFDKARVLLWQDNRAVIKVTKSWQEAQEYCTKLTVENHTQWRLPTEEELVSIVDYNKHTLAIMPAFKYIVSQDYWSATSDNKNTKKAKSIYFGNGCPDTALKSEIKYVRCVSEI